MFQHQQLKRRQREIRDSFSTSLSLRTHRALSWLNRAESEDRDNDARFIFLWISFNSAYANEFRIRRDFPERRLFLSFLNKLIRSDDEQLLYELVWQQFPNSIRLLINNKYVFQPFWDFQNGYLDEDQWRKEFEKSIATANRALGKMSTIKILAVMFDRLYVLRNQLLHGGATWNSGVNREQIAQGTHIMSLVVPVVIHLMMENRNQLWGDPCYPVVD